MLVVISTLVLARDRGQVPNHGVQELLSNQISE